MLPEQQRVPILPVSWNMSTVLVEISEDWIHNADIVARTTNRKQMLNYEKLELFTCINGSMWNNAMLERKGHLICF
jgi:hypothetical protein